MSCPACQRRKGRRQCPALGHTICSVCCGTKRLTEINCPSDCSYLTTARDHPAAVVKRQQDRDVAMLLPTIQHLTERQQQLFFLFHSVIARYKPEGFSRLHDEDVADATGALGATLETAAKGVIYEHPASSLPARALGSALTETLERIRQHGAVHDRDAAVVLRAIEQGARAARNVADGGDTAYLALMARLLQANQAALAATDAQPPATKAGSIILP